MVTIVETRLNIAAMYQYKDGPNSGFSFTVSGTIFLPEPTALITAVEKAKKIEETRKHPRLSVTITYTRQDLEI